jgi:putative ABC transport system substrate-binding protein
MPRLCTLLYSNPETDPNFAAFRQGLREVGYIEGQNLRIEYRFADRKPERLEELALDLVRLRPDVIFVWVAM